MRKLSQFLQAIKTKIRKDPELTFVVVFGSLFSLFLMFSTLSWSNGSIVLRHSLLGDFSGHIPLIRSFSYGNNLPLEYPQYLGEPMRYHFLFYAVTGALERIGFRFDIALNLLSSAGMLLLFLAVYKLTLKITGKKAAGILAIFMLIFNASFSWLYYLTPWNLNLHNISEIVLNKRFAAFGPFDGNIVSAFWNLNIYTNQRHTPIAFALMFFCIWVIAYSKRRRLLVAAYICTAIIPFLNQSVIIPLYVTLALTIIGAGKERVQTLKRFTLAVLVALPGLLLVSGGANIRFDPGFLYDQSNWKELNVHSNFLRWLIYWFLNLGFLPFASLAGFLLVKKLKFKNIAVLLEKLCSKERVFFTSAVLIFVMANLFFIPKDGMNNHKFINFVILVFNSYAAYAVYKIYQQKKLQLAAVVLFIFLILGGIFDLFPVFNNKKDYWPDLPADQSAQWIVDNTDRSSRFLALTYNNRSLTTAGRKIYFGNEHLTSTIGYDPDSRIPYLQKLTKGDLSKTEVCSFAKEFNLDYIALRKEETQFLETEINQKFFIDNFVRIANTPDYLIYVIYDFSDSCVNLN